MPSFRVLGIALFMAIVRTAPVTDGISSDGITPFIGDQLDSELNFQPLPKIISLDPTNAEPESDTGTKSGPKTPTITPKPVTTAANSELNPHRGNATSTKLPEITSADPDPPRDYFRENDFQCPKEADFIGCCDGGSFDKCETCNDSRFLHVLAEFPVLSFYRSNGFCVHL